MIKTPTTTLTSFCDQASFLRWREWPCPSAFGVGHFPRHRSSPATRTMRLPGEGVTNDATHNRDIPVDATGRCRCTRRNKASQKPVVPRLCRSCLYSVRLEAHPSSGIHVIEPAIRCVREPTYWYSCADRLK